MDVQAGPSFSMGERAVLFTLDEADVWNRTASYDVSADDDRFVVIGGRSNALASEVVVVENFFVELEERVGN